MPEPSANVVAAFAAFVRHRLVEAGVSVGGTVFDTVTAPLAPLLRRMPGSQLAVHDPAGEAGPAERRRVTTVIVAAAETFAPTAHARARLLRQAHASGLLSARETEDALGAVRAIGAPNS